MAPPPTYFTGQFDGFSRSVLRQLWSRFPANHRIVLAQCTDGLRRHALGRPRVLVWLVPALLDIEVGRLGRNPLGPGTSFRGRLRFVDPENRSTPSVAPTASVSLFSPRRSRPFAGHLARHARNRSFHQSPTNRPSTHHPFDDSHRGRLDRPHLDVHLRTWPLLVAPSLVSIVSKISRTGRLVRRVHRTAMVHESGRDLDV